MAGYESSPAMLGGPYCTTHRNCIPLCEYSVHICLPQRVVWCSTRVLTAQGTERTFRNCNHFTQLYQRTFTVQNAEEDCEKGLRTLRRVVTN
eukprot:3867089-Rhodomonas_salina.2